jgi:Ca-activated chloride channel family protein
MRTRVAASSAVVLLFAGLVTLTTVASLAHSPVASGLSRTNTSIDRGGITGRVTDSAGAALPGATVTLTGPERRKSITNERGDFAFASLLPGAYEARAELAGYQAATVKAVVRAGQIERLALAMNVAGLHETIQVAAAAPSAKHVSNGVTAGVAGGVVGGVVGGLPDGVYGDPLGRRRYAGPFDTEAYDSLDENPFRRVGVDPLSTFSIDVDTASYANVRRFLNTGALPPPGAVRIEELINYFRFDYPEPSGDAPFSVTTELAECPWNPRHRLALVGLQGRAFDGREAAPRNLVFLLDVSGSMQDADKLPLVRNAMRMLADILTARDRVAIVVYAGASGLVLPSTAGDQKEVIHRAIGLLEAGGSTNGAAGITLAYQVARDNFIEGGVNRVVLATDGDFNVGVTSQDELVRLIEEQRASGVFLSVLGVGTGNLKDSTMEKLADRGNGNYAYLDSLHEARKVLVREAGATLVTIAKDVKTQVEFNPRLVNAYRLIGYENRMLRNEDFNDDKKDAGEIGAGHSVTALYEIVPAGVEIESSGVDPLKYQQPGGRTAASTSDELLTIKLRYKQPDGDTSRLITTIVRNQPQPMGANIGFASAVAEAGMLLRKSKHAGSGSYASAAERARRYRGDDPEGYRIEFVRLIELASSLGRSESTTSQRR